VLDRLVKHDYLGSKKAEESWIFPSLAALKE
jgi:hypothetical protein